MGAAASLVPRHPVAASSNSSSNASTAALLKGQNLAPVDRNSTVFLSPTQSVIPGQSQSQTAEKKEEELLEVKPQPEEPWEYDHLRCLYHDEPFASVAGVVIGGGGYLVSNHLLGKGSFGVVMDGLAREVSATKRSPSLLRMTKAQPQPQQKYREVAIKMLDMNALSSIGGLAGIENELALLAEVKGHRSIIQVEDAFVHSHHTIYIVMEKIQGGQLMDTLSNREGYTEQDARSVAYSLLEVLTFIHSRKVAHRDIKLQNIMLRDPAKPANIVLIDFEFAAKVDGNTCLGDLCGTPEFIAPEVMKVRSHGTKYGAKCDVWSAGVIIFALLGGYLPFSNKNPAVLMRSVLGGHYKLYKEYWQDISHDAMDLVTCLLTTDPTERCDAREALQHEWFRGKKEMYKKNELRQSLSNLQGGWDSQTKMFSPSTEDLIREIGGEDAEVIVL